MRHAALAALALLAVGCGASTLPPVRSEAERFEVARKLILDREYGHAVNLLKPYVESHVGRADADGAMYLLGLGYLGMHDWTAASIEFERLLRDYPESDSAGSASFKLGEAFIGQARPTDFDQEYTHKALDQWNHYVSTYPGHWMRPQAERRIAETRRKLASKLLNTANLYLKLDLADPARAYYVRIDKEYGDLDIVADAWLGLARLDSRRGLFLEAIEAYRRIEERFPGGSIAKQATREREALERKHGVR